MAPILLIHGFPFDADMWRNQVDFLRRSRHGIPGHTVLTPNLPGFGDAPALARDESSIEAFAAGIHEIIQRDAGGKAVVGGFSMGGYVLLALLRDYPDSVAAAIFIDTRADADTPDAHAARLKTIDDVHTHGPTKLCEAMLPRILRKRPSAAAQGEARALMEKQPPQAAINALSAMARRRDQTDLLPQLRLPVLIIVGSEDAITPPSVALAMQSHMPHAMVVQVASAGHLTPIEQPAAVNAAIDTFLATLK